jgi:hypothetical protein
LLTNRPEAILLLLIMLSFCSWIFHHSTGKC